MGTFVWQWPQITWAAITAVALGLACLVDGRPRSGTYSAATSLIGIILGAVMLYFGGFFTEVRP